ncbi:3-isopropylmalate dehydratase small subunit [Sphingomonas sp. GB1N7]|uniref:3-isopropylmalate dehydratase small subunit n=1 Tax=Parasphingomonas caseinilytica TaxID=3096158 RepID=UPI002FCBBE7C
MSDAFPPSVVSRGTVLRVDNVDTDVITPIARVLEGREAVVRFAFEPLRFDEDGNPRADDPFAHSARESAEILIAGRNFGCGSSRETAAVAVRGMGFRVVIAASYGDIFYSNCLKNGVLAVRLPPNVVDRLMAAATAAATIAVDLPAQTVRCDDIDAGFEIGALQKEMLLSGLDEIGMMLSRSAARSAFVAGDRLARAWVRDRVRVG